MDTFKKGRQTKNDCKGNSRRRQGKKARKRKKIYPSVRVCACVGGRGRKAREERRRKKGRAHAGNEGGM